MIETCIHCGKSGPLDGPGGELVPAGYPDFAHQRCLAAADDGLGIGALATASLQFSALADKLPACPHRDALRLAGRIANSLSSLRCAVSEVVLDFDGWKITPIDATRALRRALEEAAKGGDHA